MKHISIKSAIGVFLLFAVQAASADLYYTYGVYISTVHNEVRANVTGISYIVDEMERVDVSASLYVDDVIDISLSGNSNSCHRVLNETIQCHTRASHSPISAGCKYCGDFRIRSFRNDESNPNNPPDWVIYETVDKTDCETAPSGGGGGGGGGQIP